jgi:hypothetical protein
VTVMVNAGVVEAGKTGSGTTLSPIELAPSPYPAEWKNATENSP